MELIDEGSFSMNENSLFLQNTKSEGEESIDTYHLIERKKH